MQFSEMTAMLGLLLVVANISVVSSIYTGGSRYPYMPAILSDAISSRSWEECAGQNEACYKDDGCCGKMQCLRSANVRGPLYTCQDVPSRSYRHLVHEPADVDNGARVSVLGLEGEECKSTADCNKGLCCKNMFIFRKGVVQKCGQPSYFSECM